MTKQILSNFAMKGNAYGPGSYDQDTPAKRGWIDWNFPITHMHNGFGPSSGVIYLMKFTAWTGGLVTNLLIGQNSKQGTPVASQNWMGIYDSSGSRIAQTADQSTAFNGTTPIFISSALQSTVTLTQGSAYWFALLYNQSGGVGQSNFYATSLGNTYSMMNAGYTGYNSLCSSYGTGQTTLPASITTASASPSGGILFWMGCS